jgi:hypothetical protein
VFQHHVKAYGGSGSIAAWQDGYEWVASCLDRCTPFPPPRKSPLLNENLGGPQNLSGQWDYIGELYGYKLARDLLHSYIDRRKMLVFTQLLLRVRIR